MVTLRPGQRRHEVETRPPRPTRPAALAPTTNAICIWLLLLTFLCASADGLRCYVCGGSTGRNCEEIVTRRRWSPYVRPRPVLTSDGKRQWEECNDLINNKGCIKQVVNGGKKTQLNRHQTPVYKSSALRVHALKMVPTLRL